VNDEKINLTADELYYLRRKHEKNGASASAMCVFFASFLNLVFIFVDIPKHEIIMLISTISICAAAIPTMKV